MAVRDVHAVPAGDARLQPLLGCRQVSLRCMASGLREHAADLATHLGLFVLLQHMVDIVALFYTPVAPILPRILDLLTNFVRRARPPRSLFVHTRCQPRVELPLSRNPACMARALCSTRLREACLLTLLVAEGRSRLRSLQGELL